MKRPLFALLPAALQRRASRRASRASAPSLKFWAYAGLAVVIGGRRTSSGTRSRTRIGGGRADPRAQRNGREVRSSRRPRDQGLAVRLHRRRPAGLAFLLLRWLSRQTPQPLDSAPALPRRWKVVVGLVAVVIPAAAAVAVWNSAERSRYERLGRSVTASGLALSVVVLAYGLAFPLIERRAEQDN